MGMFLVREKWCLDSADITSIVKACPQLQALSIINTVQPGADLSPLLQLPKSCVSLSVAGVAFTNAAASVVSQLTQLQELE
jgi:hypothetical protein